MSTYIDAVLAGEATHGEIDDWIDLWHDGAGEGLTLVGFLGLDDAEFRDWINGRLDDDEVTARAVARREAASAAGASNMDTRGG